MIPPTGYPRHMNSTSSSRCIGKDYTLAERTLGTKSWMWKYGVDIQCSTKRRWVCLPCIRHKRHPAMSCGSKGTQNIHTHLWSAHRLQDPSGRNPKNTLASI